MGAATTGRQDDGDDRGRAMGAAIRALRRHVQLSQIALAERVRTHANYLGALERGEVTNPGLDIVTRIAHGLDVSVVVLAETYADPPAGGALRVDATRPRPHDARRGCDARALGQAIRVLRRRQELTQEQLAVRAGLHRNHLGSIETGARRNPGVATIARVASGLQRPGATSPLPLLAQVFAGEVTIEQLRRRPP